MKGWLLALMGVGIPLLVMMAAWRVWVAPDEPPKPKPISTIPSRTAPQPETKASAAVPDDLERWDDWLEAWSHRLEQLADKSDPGPTAAASTLLRTGQYKRAVDAFDRLLVRAPDDAVLLIGKAMALSGAERHEDALPLLERVIELEPGNVAARFNRAVCLMRLGQRREATAALEAIVREQPAYWTAKFNLAVLYQADGKLNEAIALWRQLTDAETTTQPTVRAGLPDAWFHRGEAALVLHRNDEAEQCFTKVLALNPKEDRAWCNIGIARSALGRRDDAVVALNEALKIDPKQVAAINQMAMIHAANYRDTSRPEDRQKVLDLCGQSLAIDHNQPNIRELRDALLKE
jgi:tetratricopeptide (TPR) repeat protein